MATVSLLGRGPKVGAGIILGTVVGLSGLVVGAQPAVAADGPVEVINTETVQVHTSPVGEVLDQRVYEQLSLIGAGEVDLRNPIETDGLRNLDGFAGVEIEDGQQRVTGTVDGTRRLRTVSDFNGDLPVELSIEYFLDNEPVQPGDVVGASGQLQVEFTVRNRTAQQVQVEVADGRGGTVTRSVEVPVPLVGSLTTVAPSNFTQVRSDQANLAGDGRGGTLLSFTMTLFPPIGSDTASFGYTAQITDGVVPGASMSVLPVDPLASPTFATAAASYQGGADTGATLVAGATTIDENLLKLRDGAGDLLAGLIQLNAGAEELRSGLAGRAAPGARDLSDGARLVDEGVLTLKDGTGKLRAGARQVRDGARQLDGGAGKLRKGADDLSAGAGDLAAGTGEARSGSAKLTDGLGKISAGLGQLADRQQGLPALGAGIDQLQQGVDRLLAGFGAPGSEDTLLDGLTRLEAGAATLHAGSGELVAGLDTLGDRLGGARDGAGQIRDGLDDAVRPGGRLDQLVGGLTVVKSTDCGPICTGIIDDQILPAVDGSREGLEDARDGLQLLIEGLTEATGELSAEGRLGGGARELRGGLDELSAGATRAVGGAGQLRDGARQLREGLGKLEAGVTAAVQGVLQLSGGAQSAYGGSQDLTAGLGKLDAGAGKLKGGADKLAAGAGDLKAGTGDLAGGAGALSSGAGDLDDGAAKLAGGTTRLRSGAAELATGIDDAATGSGRLAAGLSQASAGAPRLVEGAERLSEEGMGQLIEAGESTAVEYGEMYAVLATGAERAQREKMAYGAPEGAVGLMAYSYTIQGEDGEGSRNLLRGLGAVLLLGLGAGVYAVRRRAGSVE